MKNETIWKGALIVIGIIAIGSYFTHSTTVVEQSTPLAGVTNYDQLSLDAATLPQLKIATTSPVTNGEVVIDSTSTSTIVMMSSASGKGSCIQFESNTGAPVAVYVVGTTVTTAAGTCK